MVATQQIVERRIFSVGTAELEAFCLSAGGATRTVCAAHPAAVFSEGTAALLSDSSRANAVCVNLRGIGRSTGIASSSFEEMVDDLEAVRSALRLPRWVFWGMSGGGWLAQVYAHRHPDALSGIIVESACACFRERLGDETCALSPFFPAWLAGLDELGLHDSTSHRNPSSARNTEWIDVKGVGHVFRRMHGPALVVSPMPIDPEMRRAMPLLWSFDSRGWLGEVRLPALVLAGSADLVVPVHRVRDVAERIAGSEFIVVERGGHVPSSERRPEALFAARRFIDSL